MGLPQYIYLGLLVLSLGITLAKHGERRTDKHSFFTSLTGAAITIWLLAWGGFFG